VTKCAAWHVLPDRMNVRRDKLLRILYAFVCIASITSGVALFSFAAVSSSHVGCPKEK
jgi:hypothetical protein